MTPDKEWDRRKRERKIENGGEKSMIQKKTVKTTRNR